MKIFATCSVTQTYVFKEIYPFPDTAFRLIFSLKTKTTMNGTVYNCFGEMVETRFGKGAWVALLQRVGIDYHFTDTAIYPDELLFSLVNAAYEITGVGTKELIQSFNLFMLPHGTTSNSYILENEVLRRQAAEHQLERKISELNRSKSELGAYHSELEKTHKNLRAERTERAQLLETYASLTNDLQLAAQLQSELLPSPVKAGRYSALGYLQPARYVAGDGFDYFMLPDNVLAFYIIDVEGHGTSSAMTSFAIHSQLNPKLNGICRQNLDKCSDHAEAVCATVRDLNKTFYSQKLTSKYFTMIYGLLDLSTGAVTWCQAGHPAPILSTSATAAEIGDGGFPIGTLENPVFSASTCHMNPKDRLVLYSDGSVECFSTNGEIFGKARLFKLLEEAHDCDQEKCISTIKHQLLAWNGGDEFADDVTMLLIDYHGPSAGIN